MAKKDFDVEAWRETKKDQSAQLEKDLTEKILTLRSTEEWQKYLDTTSHLESYSFHNMMLIYMQKPDALHVGGYGFWKKEKNPVKKGEKAIYIVAPIIKKLDSDGIESVDGEKKAVGFHYVPVFDVSQTEAGRSWYDELNQCKELTFEAEDAFINMQKVVTHFGINLEETESLPPGVKGAFMPEKNTIYLLSSMSSGMKVKTLSHELAHSLTLAKNSYTENRELHELAAESTAYVVCQRLGIDTAEYSIAYLGGWSRDIKDEDLKEVIKVLSDAVSNAANKIYDTYQTFANPELTPEIIPPTPSLEQSY
jgi:antirestriction protein ArdC